MTEPVNQSVLIQGWLDQLRAGDESARGRLLDCACKRLERLTRTMLASYPRLKRWEQTDDVLQNSLLRLYRALAEVHPATARDFFRLAALNIRRELLDLAKHYYGPCGPGARHASTTGEVDSDGHAAPFEPAAPSTELDRLAFWTEFHDRVEHLPDEEREVFDLLWYQELSQAEAAGLLNVSERTIKRRWAAARLKLHDLLRGALPEP